MKSANRSKDGRKGGLYRDLGPDRYSQSRSQSVRFRALSFVWKQGGKDMRFQELAYEYLGNLEKNDHCIAQGP